jgi:hypothetical protein
MEQTGSICRELLRTMMSGRRMPHTISLGPIYF